MILVVSIRRIVVVGRFVIGRLVVRLLVLYAKAQVLLTAKIINILLQNINATMSVYKWKSVSFPWFRESALMVALFFKSYQPIRTR